MVQVSMERPDIRGAGPHGDAHRPAAGSPAASSGAQHPSSPASVSGAASHGRRSTQGETTDLAILFEVWRYAVDRKSRQQSLPTQSQETLRQQRLEEEACELAKGDAAAQEDVTECGVRAATMLLAEAQAGQRCPECFGMTNETVPCPGCQPEAYRLARAEDRAGELGYDPRAAPSAENLPFSPGTPAAVPRAASPAAARSRSQAGDPPPARNAGVGHLRKENPVPLTFMSSQSVRH